MLTNMIPFNLDLLIITPEQAKYIGQVKVLDTFMASSRNFHPEGLFSTEIFGRVGDKVRNITFGYIDIKVDILHPLIFEILLKLKNLYGDILSSSVYAVWDKESKDFIKSTPLEGETGYTFFMSHFNKIDFKRTDSDRRDFYIRLIDKYRENCFLDKLLVMPAGLRDYEIDKDGKPSKDEINDFYIKIISLSNLLAGVSKKTVGASLDGIRYKLQLNVYELYEYIKSLLEGKHKLILSKWGGRRIVNGSRNVITSIANDTDELNSNLTSGFNDTMVGLYQFIKATLPLAIYAVRNGILSRVFKGSNMPVFLINKKTLIKEKVDLSGAIIDKWISNEGLEALIDSYKEETMRDIAIEIEDRYLGLIYNDGKLVMFLDDIEMLPSQYDKMFVAPITYTELLYMAVSEYSKEMYGFFTRYPITGYGSIYPCSIFLKTTIPSASVVILDIDTNETKKLTQFPIKKAEYMNSMAPAHSHLKRLGADFDGDTCSLNIVYTEEALKEIKKMLRSRKYYVDGTGNMNFSSQNDSLEFTLASMTA